MQRILMCAIVLIGCGRSYGRSSNESPHQTNEAAPSAEVDGAANEIDASADAASAADSGEAPPVDSGRPKPGGDRADAAAADAGSPHADPSEEVCDGQDNDLDGRVDENSYVCYREAPAASIDELITRCPSAATLAAIDADLDLRFEQGILPKGQEIVCTAAQSGRALTHFEERVYQALIAMRAIQFDRPLPWTDLGLYEWVVHEVRGIWFRSDIGISQCCTAPPGKTGPYVNIAVGGGATIFQTDLWGNADGGLYTLVSLLAHEVRHVAKGHSCKTIDTTIAELGALGVEYYLYTYLAYHADACFLRPKLEPSSKYPASLRGDAAYLELARSSASRVQTTRFCAEPSLPLTQPTPVRTCGQTCVAREERCNLVDDDCDGAIDEAIQALDCGLETGECTLGKVSGCDAGLERCSGQRPVTEICGDGLDNDCDGMADGGSCSACADTTGAVFDGSIAIRSTADLAAIAGVGCVTGTLHVITGFTDLSAFSQLQAVGGDMWVLGNTQLQDLQGLRSLRRVGRLFVENNPELRSVRGLESLTNIDTFHLMVTGNHKLESLDGLSGLRSIANQLIISENSVLQRIDGLTALTHVGGGVFVHDNPMLPACRVQTFLQTHSLSCTDCSNNDAAATCSN